MNVKEAVRMAVQCVTDIYAAADGKHVDVDEIAFDELSGICR